MTSSQFEEHITNPHPSLKAKATTTNQLLLVSSEQEIFSIGNKRKCFRYMFHRTTGRWC